MSTKGYVPEIDGLRAVAVVSVVVHHLNSAFLRGGFTGVDIFFVISGYVVTQSLLFNIEQNRDMSWRDHVLEFYARRFRRIIPALLCCLSAIFVLTCMFIPKSYLSAQIETTGRAAFWGVSNFVLAFNVDTYFGPRAEYNPFTHTWSLGVEEQFYVFVPVILIFAARARMRFDDKLSLQTMIVAGLIIFSFALAIHWQRTNANWAFYLLPSRLWEIGAGSLICLIQRDLRTQRIKWPLLLPNNFVVVSSRLSFLFGAALILAGFLLSDPERFPFPWALLPVAGSVLVILAVTSSSGAGRFSGWLKARPVVFVGLISYSLYLWHWPIIVLFRWTIGIESASSMVFAAALSIALAIGSWHFVERPFREGLPKLAPKVLVFGSLAAVFVVSQINAVALKGRDLLSLSVTRDLSLWHTWANLNGVPTDGPLSNRRMFVIGNSHAIGYSPMFLEAERELGIEVVIMTDMRCRIGEIQRQTATDPDCLRIRDDLLHSLVTSSKPGDIVLFASLRIPRLCDQWELFPYEEVFATTRSAGYTQSIAQSVAETEALIEQLKASGLRVMFDLPKPVLPAPTFRCSDWFNNSNPICVYGLEIGRSKLETLRKPVVEALKDIKSRHPDVMLWDPFPVLCPGSTCSAFDATGKPLFFDGDHLSAHGNRVLYPSFRRFLSESLIGSDRPPISDPS